MKILLQLIKDAVYALIPPVAVLVLFAIRIIVLPSHYELDVLMHFLGGASIAWMALILWGRWAKRGWIPKGIPWWLQAWTVLGTVAIVGVLWEFYELLVFFHTGIHLQFSIAETMGDLFMDLSGGVLLIILALLRKKWLK